MRTWGACTHPQRTRRWGWAPWWAPSHSTRRPSRRFPPSGVPRAFPQAARRPVARGNEARGHTRRYWEGGTGRDPSKSTCMQTWGGGEGCPFNRRTMRRVRRNDGARSAARVSGWRWNERRRGIFGSSLIRHKTKARSYKLRNGIPVARNPVTFSQTHQLTIENVMPPVSNSVPLGSYTWISPWGREVTAGGRHFSSTFVHRGATSRCTPVES